MGIKPDSEVEVFNQKENENFFTRNKKSINKRIQNES